MTTGQLAEFEVEQILKKYNVTGYIPQAPVVVNNKIRKFDFALFEGEVYIEVKYRSLGKTDHRKFLDDIEKAKSVNAKLLIVFVGEASKGPTRKLLKRIKQKDDTLIDVVDFKEFEKLVKDWK